MKRYTLVLLLALLIVSVVALQADIIHVPSQQPTIQAGIDAAVDGDTVLVADGTYTGDGNRDIDFLGKAIVVMSENGAESCVIDCEGAGRGFYFGNGEDSNSVLQGFTITNGSMWDFGGGIYCENSSPTITSNTITGNTAQERSGGGIYCREDSSPTITNNTIEGNDADEYGGGIYYRYDSSPTITSNTISGNWARWGGGIYCDDSLSIITDNTITGNTTMYSGGGIECGDYSSPTITNNTISQNTSGSGGGISCRDNSSPTITSNTITENTVDKYGGGIYCRYDSSPTITGNTISGNTATGPNGMGGGISCRENSFPTITSNTITGNTAGYGGGIYCEDYSSPTITNSILWDNSPDEIYVSSENPVVTYSDVEGGWTGEGNIDEDPLFVWHDDSGRIDSRLLWDSPCIDTGHPDSLDADSTRSDMGAHYFNQDDYLTLYMTPGTTEVAQGGQMGVTYTIINRWQQKEPFSALTRVTLPDGEVRTVLGPEDYEICPGYTFQTHLTYDIPLCAYLGMYEYQGAIGVPPSTLYDDDSFTFKVTE